MLYKSEEYTHTYPFCWRCATPLLYYARPTWYIRTSKLKENWFHLTRRLIGIQIILKMEGLEIGLKIIWIGRLGGNDIGEHLYQFGNVQICGHQECIGSVEELSEKTGKDLTGLDLHRPHVDEIEFPCSECGEQMHRVPELIDVWFDSGSMPVAQWHYPFENEEDFKKQFPADYICEAVDQTRGWFYSLHAISYFII